VFLTDLERGSIEGGGSGVEKEKKNRGQGKRVFPIKRLTGRLNLNKKETVIIGGGQERFLKGGGLSDPEKELGGGGFSNRRGKE